MNKGCLFKLSRLTGVCCVWALMHVPQAEAAILNMGVDINADGTFSMTSFFDHSDEGKTVTGGWNWLGLGIIGFSGETYTLVLDTAAVYGAYAIHAAELFVDATAISNDDNAQLRVQGSLLGELANTSNALTRIPLITGGSTPTPQSNDVDNSFFSLPLLIAGQLATDSTFEISFRNADYNYGFFPNPNNFRVDGINIQAEVSPLASSVIPEPASLILFGFGGLGALGMGRRRQTRATC